jgi:hypothetical protein
MKNNKPNIRTLKKLAQKTIAKNLVSDFANLCWYKDRKDRKSMYNLLSCRRMRLVFSRITNKDRTDKG